MEGIFLGTGLAGVVAMSRCAAIVFAVLSVTLATAGDSASAQPTTVVRADNAPLWGNSPRVVEEVRIGVLDGDERYTFGSVIAVAVTTDGTMWVADRMLYKIRRYDANGVHVGDVGRRGEGPGEFSSLNGLRSLSDGRLAAWDPALSRVSRFNTDGTYVDAILINENRGMLSGRHQYFEVDQAGNFYVASPSFVSGTATFLWIRVRPNGQVIDSIRNVIAPATEGHVFPLQTVSVISPHGYLVVGRTETYSFTQMRSSGNTLRIERPTAPVLFERPEREEAQRLEDFFAGRTERSVRRVPPEKPAWAWYRVDVEGRMWVERYAAGFSQTETPAERELRERFDNPPRLWRQPVVYDVVDSEGRFLGTLPFPGSSQPPNDDRLRIMHAQGLRVWTVERGDYGEQYVVRYRIEIGR
jgi:hypothetical protein